MKCLMGMLVVLAVLLTAGVASAHVTVWPRESTTNGFERYTIRVPVEKEIATTKVRVELPAGSTFSAVLPMPGWTFSTEKDSAGKVSALVWSGGEIKPGEFLEFGVSVRNPKDAGTVAWKAYQTYADGSTVEWAGAAGADTPAPTVTLKAVATTGPTEMPAQPSAPTPAPATQGAGADWGLYLGIASLVLSAGALVVALRARR